MKILVVISLAIMAADAYSDSAFDSADWDQLLPDYVHFSQWAQAHKKIYPTETEHNFRFKIFRENKKRIAEHNRMADKGKYSYYLKINSHGDMLRHEFTALMNGYRMDLKQNKPDTLAATFIAPEGLDAPTAIDWRTKGAVTKIKNQGPCGSCWAFSSTGSLEGQHFRKTGKLVSLSEQNLLDCTDDYGNQGCDGGFMDNAFKYVYNNHGIDTEISYPYQGMEYFRCRFSNATVGATDKGYVDIPKGDEDALAKAVATVGPVSVAIDASHDSFMFYSHGIYQERACSSENIDHAVLVVGYNPGFWIVKNSWGTEWGDNGYVKMKRGINMCAIASFASYPLV